METGDKPQGASWLLLPHPFPFPGSRTAQRAGAVVLERRSTRKVGQSGEVRTAEGCGARAHRQESRPQRCPAQWRSPSVPPSREPAGPRASPCSPGELGHWRLPDSARLKGLPWTFRKLTQTGIGAGHARFRLSAELLGCARGDVRESSAVICFPFPAVK